MSEVSDENVKSVSVLTDAWCVYVHMYSHVIVDSEKNNIINAITQKISVSNL